MKLKYYLRGLAIGVVLTTLILTIANADNKPLTDAQIRQRALELGMVESSSLKLTDVQGEGKESTDSNEPAKDSGESATAEPSMTTDMQETADVQTTTDTQEATDVASETDVQVATESSTVQESSSSDTQTVEKTQDTTVVTITIKGGDSSYTVSKAMAAAGAVEDAVDFDNYLCNYGYSRSIRTGTYEIRTGMTYEEIAKLIAG